MRPHFLKEFERLLFDFLGLNQSIAITPSSQGSVRVHSILEFWPVLKEAFKVVSLGRGSSKAANLSIL